MSATYALINWSARRAQRSAYKLLLYPHNSKAFRPQFPLLCVLWAVVTIASVGDWCDYQFFFVERCVVVPSRDCFNGSLFALFFSHLLLLPFVVVAVQFCMGNIVGHEFCEDIIWNYPMLHYYYSYLFIYVCVSLPYDYVHISTKWNDMRWLSCSESCAFVSDNTQTYVQSQALLLPINSTIQFWPSLFIR